MLIELPKELTQTAHAKIKVLIEICFWGLS